MKVPLHTRTRDHTHKLKVCSSWKYDFEGSLGNLKMRITLPSALSLKNYPTEARVCYLSMPFLLLLVRLSTQN